MFILSAVILASLTAPMAFGSVKADVQLLEHPQAYVVLDGYEQPLNPEKPLPSLAPLRVVQAKTTLGDGITPARQVDFEGKVYYLLLDERGQLALKPGKKSNHSLLKNCQWVGDTASLSAKNGLSYSAGLSPGRSSGKLDNGKEVERIFQYRRHLYLRPLAKAGPYIWCADPGANAWKKKSQALPRQDEGLNPHLAERIQARLSAANRDYAQLFEAFDRTTGHARKAPSWTCEARKDGMRCRLEAPAGTANALERSTAYLVQDLENILLGKPFAVSYKQGAIDIMARRP